MLAQAEQADVIMAPAADMFEMGVKVQVLKRGTMFAMRAARLYELYRAYPEPRRHPRRRPRDARKDHLPRPARQTSGPRPRRSGAQRDPAQVARAEPRAAAQDGAGVPLVSGPVVALGQRRRRRAEGRLPGVVRPGDGGVQRVDARDRSWKTGATAASSTVAQNLMHGAAVLTRLHFLRCQGVEVPAEWGRVAPAPDLRL